MITLDCSDGAKNLKDKMNMPGQATVSKNIAPNLCHKLPKYICALTTLHSTDEWRDLTIVAFFLRRGKANRGEVLSIQKSQIKRTK